MQREKEKIRVIHVFDNAKDATQEMFNHADGTIKKPKVHCAMGEKQVLMNVASNVYGFMLMNEADEISKAELDLFLRRKPLPPKVLVNVSPLDFNFVLRSSINKRFYTNSEYYLEDIDDSAYTSIIENYNELSIMYSFDSIFEQMQKMVTDFKAAHHDFDKMTMDERMMKFRSWQDNEDYINNEFLDNLLDKCIKTKS